MCSREFTIFLTPIQYFLNSQWGLNVCTLGENGTENGSVAPLYLELFLQAVHLGPQGVNDVLAVLQHKVLQLISGLHLLDVLQATTKTHMTR